MFMKWHVPWGEEGAQVTGKQPLTLACPLSMLVTRKTEQLLAVSRLSCSGGIFPLSGALWSQSRVQGGGSAVRVKRRRSGCSRRPREFQKKYAGLLSSGSCRLSWRKISRKSVTLSLPLIGKPALTLQMYRAESMGEERRVS